MRIDGKMRRHPIDQNANTSLVRAIDKARETVGIAKAGRWRIKTGGLIAPAWIIGMLADGQKFDMGEAHFHHIGNKPIGQRIPGQEIAIGIALP